MSGTQTRTLADLKDALAAQQAVAPAGTAPVVPTDRPHVDPKRDALGRSYATGRRKNAVARVWIKPGKGEITVNDKKVVQYFARPVLRMLLTQPFLVADRFTLADIALYAYTHVAPEAGLELGSYPAIRDWIARVAAQPGHAPITAP